VKGKEVVFVETRVMLKSKLAANSFVYLCFVVEFDRFHTVVLSMYMADDLVQSGGIDALAFVLLLVTREY
jgi:hypothetical protein